ncbi:hypothetical protein ACPCHT_03070 [Nucisporomicrobium flavum]|uniref:hypothetical protein n=1 Tax=Nucisporomicrobium flavum TaxID=2785915 RepID=UPI003C2AC0A3
MDRKAARPETTKEQLIRDGEGRLGARYRCDFAARLLSGRIDLPQQWLNENHRAFIEMERDSFVDRAHLAAARDLTGRVVRLCTLVYRVIDDFLARDETLDQKDRAALRQGRGPAAVCEVLFRECAEWPAADPRRLRTPVQVAVDEALRAVVHQRRAGQRTPLPGAPAATSAAQPVTPGRPLDDRHLAVWHKSLATMDAGSLRRHLIYDSAEDFHLLVKMVGGLAVMVSLAAAYVALFLALRYFAPALSTRQDMLVTTAALSTAVGPAGLTMAAGMLSARRGRRRATGDRSGAE